MIAAQMPLAWRWVGQLAAEHLQLSLAVIDDLMIRNPTARAVAVLLRLAGYRTGSIGCMPAAEVDVTQESLAVMANLSRSSVGSILRSLERRDLVEVCYRRIRVIDADALARHLADDELCPPACHLAVQGAAGGGARA